MTTPAPKPPPDLLLHNLRGKAVVPSLDEVRRLRDELHARFGDEGTAQALRTELHGILQLADPPPVKDPDDAPDEHSYRQKAHQRKLWVKTDQLIAKALGKVTGS